MLTKFLLSLLARVLPLSIAFYFAVVATSVAEKGRAYAGGILIFCLCEYLGTYRPLANTIERRKKQMDAVFGPFLESTDLSGQKVKLRANVMLARRRFLFWKRFYQFYQKNMNGWPDANLSLAINQGLCGQAFADRHQRVHFVNLTQSPWRGKMSRKEREATNHLIAIASVALIREIKTIRGHHSSEYFGCLNVDATDEPGAEVLAAADCQNKILKMAEFVEATFP